MKCYGNKGVISSARRWGDKGEKCQEEISKKCAISSGLFTRVCGSSWDHEPARRQAERTCGLWLKNKVDLFLG